MVLFNVGEGPHANGREAVQESARRGGHPYRVCSDGKGTYLLGRRDTISPAEFQAVAFEGGRRECLVFIAGQLAPGGGSEGGRIGASRVPAIS